MEKFLFRFVRGKDYHGNWTKIIPYTALYRSNSMRNVQRNGINYSLDLSCLMQWYVYWDFKARDRQRLYELVKPGSVVLDVGTNIGETLLNFAKLTEDKGFVYGFEPDDINYENVQKNISLNNFKHLHVFKKAVSDKKESVKLYCVDTHNRGMNRILDASEPDSAPYVVVETTRIDDIVRENNINRVDIIKIDIEGYEMHALLGAVETLRRFKPTLFVEVGYKRLIDNNSSPTELVKFLQDIGYKIFHSETDKLITSDYDFSHLGDGGIDVYAIAKN
jgi:FkbM family methyltransferase